MVGLIKEECIEWIYIQMHRDRDVIKAMIEI